MHTAVARRDLGVPSDGRGARRRSPSLNSRPPHVSPEVRGCLVRTIFQAAAPFAAVVESVSPDTEFTPKFLFSDRERPHLVVRVRVRVQDPERRLHSGVPAFAQVQR